MKIFLHAGNFNSFEAVLGQIWPTLRQILEPAVSDFRDCETVHAMSVYFFFFFNGTELAVQKGLCHEKCLCYHHIYWASPQRWRYTDSTQSCRSKLLLLLLILSLVQIDPDHTVKAWNVCKGSVFLWQLCCAWILLCTLLHIWYVVD